LIHAAMRIIVIEINRIRGCAKIPLPSTVTDNVKAALREFVSSGKSPIGE